jgi:hypothetical protein
MAIYNFRAFEYTKTGGSLNNKRSSDDSKMQTT